MCLEFFHYKDTISGLDSAAIHKMSFIILQAMDVQWDSKANPQYYVFIQGWMVLSLAVSIFVPKSSKLLWFLRTHFARNKDEK